MPNGCVRWTRLLYATAFSCVGVRARRDGASRLRRLQRTGMGRFGASCEQYQCLFFILNVGTVSRGAGRSVVAAAVIARDQSCMMIAWAGFMIIRRTPIWCTRELLLGVGARKGGGTGGFCGTKWRRGMSRKDGASARDLEVVIPSDCAARRRCVVGTENSCSNNSSREAWLWI